MYQLSKRARSRNNSPRAPLHTPCNIGASRRLQTTPLVRSLEAQHRKQSNFHYIKCYGLWNSKITHRKSLILLAFQQWVNRPFQNTTNQIRKTNEHTPNFWSMQNDAWHAHLIKDHFCQIYTQTYQFSDECPEAFKFKKHQ